MTLQNQDEVKADAPTAEQPPFSRKVVILLAGLSALSTLSTNIILPAFPAIGAQFGVTARELALTLSSFFITFALAQLVVGPLADRFGRQKVVTGGLILFMAGTVTCGLADSLDTLIAGRIIQASGVCAATVLSRAIARDLFDGEALAHALSLIMIATATAPGFSPLIGSVLTTALGWRAIFILVGLAAFIVAISYTHFLGETQATSTRAPHSFTEVVAAYIRLAATGKFILPALSVSLVMSGLFALFGAAPAILMSGMGLSLLQTGLFFASTVFVVFAAGMAAPRLARRYGAQRVTLTGIFIALVAGLLLLTGPASPGLSGYTLSTILFLLGMGLANPLGTAITMGPFGSQAGLASALLGFLTMTAAAMSTWLCSVLPLPAVTALGAIQATACLIALLLFWLRGRLIQPSA